MIVLDANVVIYWATDSPEADQVERLREHDSDWRTAQLWRYEFTNALVNLVRARRLSDSAALDAMTRANAWLAPREHAVWQPDVLRVALRDQISGYDAQYVALAESLATKCVTADKALAKKCPHATILLADFAK